MEMLITQALDERDLLKKKINDAINSTNFVSLRKVGKDTDFQNAPVEKITADIQSTYQSINDMIARYYTIIQKIAESNATTIITVNDEQMTISAAISILKDISNREYFKSTLIKKLESNFNNISSTLKRNNDNVDGNKNLLLQQLVNRNADKNKPSEEDIAIVEKMVANDYAEIIDPIDIANKIKALKEEDLDLKAKILMAIKISNATTVIDI